MTKISSEQESRKNLLSLAKKFKCEKDVKMILDKYDRALKNCTNELERQAIGTAGLAELHKFFYCKGALVVNGQEIIPAEEGYQDLDGPKKIIKL